MKRNPNSIDGFVSRSPRREIGRASQTSITPSGESNRQQIGVAHQTLHSGAELPQRRSISRSEIDESLNSIQDEVPTQKPKRRFLRRPRHPKKLIKRIVIALLVIAVLAGAYVGIKAFIAGGSIFKGNPFAILQNKPLKTDANGRSNILVFGTSGSIDDQRHDGANLTDTLMVLSINQKKKDAYLVSLPRDLYVEYGQACNAGFRGKINEMYFCYSNNGENEEAGATALDKKITAVTGLDIQYYAHVNWAVVVGAINAVGGVNVKVEGNGPCSYLGMPDGSVVDQNMRISYTPGVHKMDGTQALLFSRARGEVSPTCGLAQGDFDRQQNQQRVIKALQQKALSAGTLTNIGKVTSLIDTLGENLRTNFETSEVQTLMSLGKDIPSDKITSIDLVSQDDPQIVSGSASLGAGSVQVPKTGTFDYSGIAAYIKKQLNANEVTREAAHVALFNGSGVTGYASKRRTALENLGFTVTAAQNAPAGTYKDTEIYDLTNENPATKAKLESFYGVTAVQGNSPITVSRDTDFVVIYGKALKTD